MTDEVSCVRIKWFFKAGSNTRYDLNVKNVEQKLCHVVKGCLRENILKVYQYFLPKMFKTGIQAQEADLIHFGELYCANPSN